MLIGQIYDASAFDKCQSEQFLLNKNLFFSFFFTVI